MKVKDSSFSIVIAGRWNLAILNPGWLVQNLFDGNPAVQVEFSVNFEVAPRYRINNILIVPLLDRVVFTCVDNSEETLALLEKLSLKLHLLLNHTPINAVGINFSYVEDGANPILLKLITFSDSEQIAEGSWLTSEQSIKRFYVHDDKRFYLTISSDPSNFTFDFNFHYLCTNTEELKKILSDKVIVYYKESLQLLKAVYNLEIESHDQQ